MSLLDGSSENNLAVIAVTRSPGCAPAEFLDSLATATTRDPAVVLADNGHVDPSAEAAVGCRPGVTTLRIGEDIGYGAAANRAIAGLPREVGWVVVASPGITWCAGAIDELLAAARRWPRAGALGPARSETGRATERTVDWLPGCCLLLRRAAMDSVDGFDPRYFSHLADVDLGDRLTRAGWLNVAVPTAHVRHAAPPGCLPGEADCAERDRSVYRFLADRHAGPRWAPLRLAIRTDLGVRRMLAARGLHRRAG